MKITHIIGYVLLALGTIIMLSIAINLISFIQAPPQIPDIGAGIVAFLGIALLLLIYILSGLVLLIPGSLLVKGHESIIRYLSGVIILVVSFILPANLLTVASTKYSLISVLLTFPLPASLIILSGRGKLGLILLIILFIIDTILILLGI